MSATASMYLRALFLQAVFTPDVHVPLDTLWVALTHHVPIANATGEQLDEPGDGNGYARIPYPLTSEYWASSGYSEMINTQPAIFAEAAADWGLIAGWALVTDDSTGLTLAVGSLITPTPFTTGMQAVVDPGMMVCGLYD